MIAGHWAALGEARARDLHREAALGRLARPHRRPVVLAAVRLTYSRLWWAARPRASTWAPGLLRG